MPWPGAATRCVMDSAEVFHSNFQQLQDHTITREYPKIFHRTIVAAEPTENLEPRALANNQDK